MHFVVEGNILPKTFNIRNITYIFFFYLFVLHLMKNVCQNRWPIVFNFCFICLLRRVVLLGNRITSSFLYCVTNCFLKKIIVKYEQIKKNVISSKYHKYLGIKQFKNYLKTQSFYKQDTICIVQHIIVTADYMFLWL